MDHGQAVKAIQQRWLQFWPTAAPSVKYAFDNMVKSEGDFFARLFVKHATTEQWTFGNAGNQQWRCSGYIDVRLSGPVNVGRGPIDDLFKVVRNIFQGKRFGIRAGEHGVVTHATTPGELVRDKQASQEWIMSAVTPFEYFEVM